MNGSIVLLDSLRYSSRVLAGFNTPEQIISDVNRTVCAHDLWLENPIFVRRKC